jgi:hypothetical protein
MSLSSVVHALAAWVPMVSWVPVAVAAVVAAGAGIWWMQRRLSRYAPPPRKDDSPPREDGSKENNGQEEREGVTRLHLVGTGVVLVAAAGLAGLAFAMSYASLYESATWLEDTPFGDLRWMFPIGIDAVIVFFLAMDLLMEWQGQRHPLARWSAYGLSAVTIVLNVSQTGDNAKLSESLGHAGPPLVIILVSEGVATWIRLVAGLLHGEVADRIPAGRFIAHPVSTLRVARLMLGWGIKRYSTALALERSRQLATAMLRQQYGRRWRRETPRHVLWMIANGHQLVEAFRLVDALTPGVPKTAATAKAFATAVSRGRGGATPPVAHPSPAASDATRAGDSGDTSGSESTSPDALDVLDRFGLPDLDALDAEMEEWMRTQAGDTGDSACDGDGATGDGGVALLPATDPRDDDAHPGDSTASAGAATDATPADQQGDTGGDSTGDTGATAGDTLLNRARDILSDTPRMSAGRLAKELGCSRGHAGKLAKQVRQEAREATGDTRQATRDGQEAAGDSRRPGRGDSEGER